MLAAATMSGEVLSTSSQAQIEVALTKVDAKHGILAIIMNHRVIHCSSSYLINLMTSNQGNVTNFKAAISKFKLLGSGQSLWLSGMVLAVDESGHRSMREAELPA
jgi:hypothetical protein